MRLKAVQLLVNEGLPESLRNYDRTLDVKDIERLLVDVARDHPEQYSRIAKELSDKGRHASYWQGETLTLDDLKPVFNRDLVFQAMDQDLFLPRCQVHCGLPAGQQAVPIALGRRQISPTPVPRK